MILVWHDFLYMIKPQVYGKLRDILLLPPVQIQNIRLNLFSGQKYNVLLFFYIESKIFVIYNYFCSGKYICQLG